MFVLLGGVAARGMTVDGLAEAEYGAGLGFQNVATAFGNSTAGQIDTANGSELDVGYGVVISNTLYLVLAGNLENNYNKLEVFLDCRDGGQNKLRGDNPNVDGDGLNRMGTSPGGSDGLTFDTGFDADFWIGVTGGGAPYTLYANYAELLTGTGNTNGYFLGAASAGAPGTLGGGNNPYGIQATINNSNTGGVSGAYSSGGFPVDYYVSSGAGVASGVEIAIPLAAIGNPTGIIKVCAFINAPSHDYVANQALNGLLVSYCCPRPPPSVGNPGEPRNVNFNNYGTRQWFEVYADCKPGVLTWAKATNEVRELPGTNLSSSLTLWINRASGDCQQVSVRYEMHAGTATPGIGNDFYASSGTVTFAQGQLSNTVSFNALPDLLAEISETVNVILSQPTDGAIVGALSNMTVYIRDDDQDADGLSDDWETAAFGTNTVQDDEGDFDLDGQSNYDEQCAGTDPNSTGSVFEAASAMPTPGRMIIQWPSATGRTYKLDRSANLVDGFAPFMTNIPATPSLNSVTDATVGVTGYYYRVEVESGFP
jgi:hypothetical protein